MIAPFTNKRLSDKIIVLDFKFQFTKLREDNDPVFDNDFSNLDKLQFDKSSIIQIE